MASNIKARPQEEEVPEKEAPETAPDSPLLDLSFPKIASGLDSHRFAESAHDWGRCLQS
jgi:hypothetical protein